MKKIASFLLLMALFTFGITATQAVINPTMVFAAEPNLSQTVSDIEGASSVIGPEAKGKVAGLFNDGQQLAYTAVLGVLMCSTCFTAIKFRSVGDNANAKAGLKVALTFEVLGLVYLASNLGLIKFALQHFNLFQK